MSFVPGPVMMVHFLQALSTARRAFFLPPKHWGADFTTAKSRELPETRTQCKPRNEILF